jgi:tetratricopeptide (TPR) repeat protein
LNPCPFAPLPLCPFAPSRPCALALLLSALLTLVEAVHAQPLAPGLAERFSAGVAALEAGRLDEAEATFRAVLREGGDRAFVHHNLGIVLQRRGRHTAAVAEFRLAARQDPTFGPARLLTGASLLALGQPAAAIVDLDRAVALMPRELAPRLQLADACERTGNVTRLVDTYREIVALAPDEPEYAYRLGKAYLRLSQWSYERIKAIDPRSARLSQALGREYLQQGRADQARIAFEEAAARDPALPEVHLALARLHADEQRWNEAAREVERELALTPESREARELKAVIDAARAGRPRP